MWATIKLLILVIEQLLGLSAAFILMGKNDEKIGFVIAVILLSCIMLTISFGMCVKFQKLSTGLCCKYYFCCCYKCCAEHCENKWIKIDPIENKNAKLNRFGQVVIIEEPKPKGSISAPENTNTINPKLEIPEGQGQPQQTAIEMYSPSSPTQPTPSVAESAQSAYSGNSNVAVDVVNAASNLDVDKVAVLSDSENPVQQGLNVVDAVLSDSENPIQQSYGVNTNEITNAANVVDNVVDVVLSDDNEQKNDIQQSYTANVVNNVVDAVLPGDKEQENDIQQSYGADNVVENVIDAVLPDSDNPSQPDDVNEPQDSNVVEKVMDVVGDVVDAILPDNDPIQQ